MNEPSPQLQQLPPPSPEYIRWAWEVGELSYRMRGVQKKIRAEWIAAHPLGQKYYIECTRRFGKSTFLLMILVEFCIKNPGSMAGFFAPVKESLRDYIEPIINKVLIDCPDDLRPVLDATLTLTFPNKSTIIFRGSNMKQHRVRRGGDLQIAGIDEARDVDDLDTLIESVVFPSLFTTTGRLLISSTPADTTEHPLHDIKVQAEKEGWISNYTIYDASRYDPLDFTPEKIALWRKETKSNVAWQREYEAKWVKDPTKVMVPEWEDFMIQTIPRDQYFQFYHKYASLDSGVKDKTAGLHAYYDFKRALLIVEDEFVLHGEEVRTDRIATLIKAKEVELGYQVLHDRKDPKYKSMENHEKVYRRVADNDNLILVNDMNSDYDLDFFATRKDSLDAMINDVREWVKDGRIIVDKRCVELIGCLRNAIWDKKRAKLAKSKVFGHFDALMALVYLVRNVDVSTNPIPKFFGKTWATHAGVPAHHEPQTGAYQLARALKVNYDTQKARENFVRGGQ